MQKSGFFSKTPSSILLKLHQRGSFGSIIHQKKNRIGPPSKIFQRDNFSKFGPPHVPTGRNCRGCLKLPWKAPNYPKTPPTGMKHNYESFGATLGPFGYLILGFGPQNGSKANIIVFWAPFGLVSGLTGIQNTSTQCAWVGRINIMCLGPLRDLFGTPGAPKRAHFGPKGPFWGLRGP